MNLVIGLQLGVNQSEGLIRVSSTMLQTVLSPTTMRQNRSISTTSNQTQIGGSRLTLGYPEEIGLLVCGFTFVDLFLVVIFSRNSGVCVFEYGKL